MEVGLVLKGTEVKSLGDGKLQFVDAYAQITEGEVFVHQMHISEYEQGTYANHDPRRVRKLLLHRDEITRLRRKVVEKGYTLIPLEVYFRNGRAKMRLGLCKGKRDFDKRATIRDRDLERDRRRGDG